MIGKLRNFFLEIIKNRWLMIILAVALLLRIIGIQYGLPFRTSLDELGPVYGAIKMIETKTLIPSLHPDIFNYILQYPPYMSYVYIPFFLLLGGIKFIQFLLIGGNFSDIGNFKLFLAGDPSAFFIVARTISAFFGLATIFLVYKTSKNIFKNEKIALFSSAFLAFSFLHVIFSHAARHWIYVTFFFALIMYVLSHPGYSVKKRYTLSFLLAGLGMGLNYQIGLSVFFIAFWFLSYDKISLAKFFKESWVYRALGLSLFLAVLAIALHPNTTGTDGIGYTLGNYKSWSLGGLLNTYQFYISQMFSVEFVFLFFIALGFLIGFFKNRGYFLAGFGFSVFYILPFYFIYRSHDSARYLLMLYPIFAVTAGYGLHVFNQKLLEISPKFFVRGLTFFIFAFMLLVSVKSDYFLAKKDTRVQALEWVGENLPPGAKFITLVSFMRLPPTPEALSEQEKIDSLSVTQSDRAISLLPQNFYPRQKFYSINLYKVKNKNFINNIKDYAKSRGFEYLVYDKDVALLENEDALKLLSINGEIIKIVEGFSGIDGDVNNDFVGGIRHIINSKNNGPTIIIKKISEN